MNLILPQQCDTASRQKTLRLRPSKSIGAPLDSTNRDMPVKFRIAGTQAQANSMGLPMVTEQKFFVMQGATEAEGGGTFLKVVYMDTSAAFVRQKADGEGVDVVGERQINQLFVVNAHLLAGRPTHVAKMVEHAVQDPE